MNLSEYGFSEKSLEILKKRGFETLEDFRGIYPRSALWDIKLNRAGIERFYDDLVRQAAGTLTPTPARQQQSQTSLPSLSFLPFTQQQQPQTGNTETAEVFSSPTTSPTSTSTLPLPFAQQQQPQTGNSETTEVFSSPSPTPLPQQHQPQTENIEIIEIFSSPSPTPPPQQQQQIISAVLIPESRLSALIRGENPERFSESETEDDQEFLGFLELLRSQDDM